MEDDSISLQQLREQLAQKEREHHIANKKRRAAEESLRLASQEHPKPNQQLVNGESGGVDGMDSGARTLSPDYFDGENEYGEDEDDDADTGDDGHTDDGAPKARATGKSAARRSFVALNNPDGGRPKAGQFCKRILPFVKLIIEGDLHSVMAEWSMRDHVRYFREDVGEDEPSHPLLMAIHYMHPDLVAFFVAVGLDPSVRGKLHPYSGDNLSSETSHLKWVDAQTLWVNLMDANGIYPKESKALKAMKPFIFGDAPDCRQEAVEHLREVRGRYSEPRDAEYALEEWGMKLKEWKAKHYEELGSLPEHSADGVHYWGDEAKSLREPADDDRLVEAHEDVLVLPLLAPLADPRLRRALSSEKDATRFLPSNLRWGKRHRLRDSEAEAEAIVSGTRPAVKAALPSKQRLLPADPSAMSAPVAAAVDGSAAATTDEAVHTSATSAAEAGDSEKRTDGRPRRAPKPRTFYADEWQAPKVPTQFQFDFEDFLDADEGGKEEDDDDMESDEEEDGGNDDSKRVDVVSVSSGSSGQVDVELLDRRAIEERIAELSRKTKQARSTAARLKQQLQPPHRQGSRKRPRDREGFLHNLMAAGDEELEDMDSEEDLHKDLAFDAGVFGTLSQGSSEYDSASEDEGGDSRRGYSKYSEGSPLKHRAASRAAAPSGVSSGRVKKRARVASSEPKAPRAAPARPRLPGAPSARAKPRVEFQGQRLSVRAAAGGFAFDSEGDEEEDNVGDDARSESWLRAGDRDQASSFSAGGRAVNAAGGAVPGGGPRRRRAPSGARAASRAGAGSGLPGYATQGRQREVGFLAAGGDSDDEPSAGARRGGSRGGAGAFDLPGSAFNADGTRKDAAAALAVAPGPPLAPSAQAGPGSGVSARAEGPVLVALAAGVVRRYMDSVQQDRRRIAEIERLQGLYPPRVGAGRPQPLPRGVQRSGLIFASEVSRLRDSLSRGQRMLEAAQRDLDAVAGNTWGRRNRAPQPPQQLQADARGGATRVTLAEEAGAAAASAMVHPTGPDDIFLVDTLCDAGAGGYAGLGGSASTGGGPLSIMPATTSAPASVADAAAADEVAEWDGPEPALWTVRVTDAALPLPRPLIAQGDWPGQGLDHQGAFVSPADLAAAAAAGRRGLLLRLLAPWSPSARVSSDRPARDAPASPSDAAAKAARGAAPLEMLGPDSLADGPGSPTGAGNDDDDDDDEDLCEYILTRLELAPRPCEALRHHLCSVMPLQLADTVAGESQLHAAESEPSQAGDARQAEMQAGADRARASLRMITHALHAFGRFVDVAGARCADSTVDASMEEIDEDDAEARPPPAAVLQVLLESGLLLMTVQQQPMKLAGSSSSSSQASLSGYLSQPLQTPPPAPSLDGGIPLPALDIRGVPVHARAIVSCYPPDTDSVGSTHLFSVRAHLTIMAHMLRWCGKAVETGAAKQVPAMTDAVSRVIRVACVQLLQLHTDYPAMLNFELNGIVCALADAAAAAASDGEGSFSGIPAAPRTVTLQSPLLACVFELSRVIHGMPPDESGRSVLHQLAHVLHNLRGPPSWLAAFKRFEPDSRPAPAVLRQWKLAHVERLGLVEELALALPMVSKAVPAAEACEEGDIVGLVGVLLPAAAPGPASASLAMPSQEAGSLCDLLKAHADGKALDKSDLPHEAAAAGFIGILTTLDPPAAAKTPRYEHSLYLTDATASRTARVVAHMAQGHSVSFSFAPRPQSGHRASVPQLYDAARLAFARLDNIVRSTLSQLPSGEQHAHALGEQFVSTALAVTNAFCRGVCPNPAAFAGVRDALVLNAGNGAPRPGAAALSPACVPATAVLHARNLAPAETSVIMHAFAGDTLAGAAAGPARVFQLPGWVLSGIRDRALGSEARERACAHYAAWLSAPIAMPPTDVAPRTASERQQVYADLASGAVQALLAAPLVVERAVPCVTEAHLTSISRGYLVTGIPQGNAKVVRFAAPPPAAGRAGVALPPGSLTLLPVLQASELSGRFMSHVELQREFIRACAFPRVAPQVKQSLGAIRLQKVREFRLDPLLADPCARALQVQLTWAHAMLVDMHTAEARAGTMQALCSILGATLFDMSARRAALRLRSSSSAAGGGGLAGRPGAMLYPGMQGKLVVDASRQAAVPVPASASSSVAAPSPPGSGSVYASALEASASHWAAHPDLVGMHSALLVQDLAVLQLVADALTTLVEAEAEQHAADTCDAVHAPPGAALAYDRPSAEALKAAGTPFAASLFAPHTFAFSHSDPRGVMLAVEARVSVCDLISRVFALVTDPADAFGLADLAAVSDKRNRVWQSVAKHTYRSVLGLLERGLLGPQRLLSRVWQRRRLDVPASADGGQQQGGDSLGSTDFDDDAMDAYERRLERAKLESEAHAAACSAAAAFVGAWQAPVVPAAAPLMVPPAAPGAAWPAQQRPASAPSPGGAASSAASVPPLIGVVDALLLHQVKQWLAQLGVSKTAAAPPAGAGASSSSSSSAAATAIPLPSLGAEELSALAGCLVDVPMGPAPGLLRASDHARDAKTLALTKIAAVVRLLARLWHGILASWRPSDAQAGAADAATNSVHLPGQWPLATLLARYAAPLGELWAGSGVTNPQALQLVQLYITPALLAACLTPLAVNPHTCGVRPALLQLSLLPHGGVFASCSDSELSAILAGYDGQMAESHTRSALHTRPLLHNIGFQHQRTLLHAWGSVTRWRPAIDRVRAVHVSLGLVLDWFAWTLKFKHSKSRWYRDISSWPGDADLLPFALSQGLRGPSSPGASIAVADSEDAPHAGRDDANAAELDRARATLQAALQALLDSARGANIPVKLSRAQAAVYQTADGLGLRFTF